MNVASLQKKGSKSPGVYVACLEKKGFKSPCAPGNSLWGFLLPKNDFAGSNVCRVHRRCTSDSDCAADQAECKSVQATRKSVSMQAERLCVGQCPLNMPAPSHCALCLLDP